MIPETCHALVQLTPGLLPLLPRVSIGIVLLLNFWDTEPPLVESKDPNFFLGDGNLTSYAAGTILAFEAYVGLRLLIVLISTVVLWTTSSRTDSTAPRRKKDTRGLPVKRDPARALAPQRSWLTREDRFEWDWRERSRRRLQDAFELCLTRNVPRKTSTIATPMPSKPHLGAGADFNPVHPKPSTPFYTPGTTPTSAIVETPFTAAPTPKPLERATETLESGSEDEDSKALISSRSTSRAEGVEAGAKAGSSDGHAPSSYHTPGRRRAASTSSGSLKAMSRARSTSFSSFKDTVNSTARRVRSGTLISTKSQYSRVDE